MKQMHDLRADFPMLQQTVQGYPLIYLDNAATTFKPTCVIEAMNNFYRCHYGTVHRAVYHTAQEATQRYHAARQTVQTFLNASQPEEIVFTRGTTASLNLVARSLAEGYLRRGDVVLLSTIEHHSNLVPWQMVAEKQGIVLRFIPVDERGELILDVFETLLDERVKLVSVAHITNAIGTLNPLAYIIERAHAYGALVCVDGAQSAAHLPLDVQALDVDFFAFSGHKVYGPTGIGVLYGKRDLLEKMPPIEGGGRYDSRCDVRENHVHNSSS